MSLTTALIAISSYVRLPTDVANLIAQYGASETDKWIPQHDIHGHISYKVNSDFFYDLAKVCYTHPALLSGRNRHTVILNHTTRYDNAITYVYHRYFDENHDLHISLYTSIETAPEVFDYMTMTYVVSPTTDPVRQFVKGTLHRPSEILSWNREQRITSLDMLGDTMFVNYTEIHVEYMWNDALNIGEYILTGDIGDDNDDDITWASLL